MLLTPQDLNGKAGEPRAFHPDYIFQVRQQVEFERFANDKRKHYLLGEARAKCRQLLDFVPVMHQPAIQWLEVTQPSGHVLVLARYPGKWGPLALRRGDHVKAYSLAEVLSGGGWSTRGLTQRDGGTGEER